MKLVLPGEYCSTPRDGTGELSVLALGFAFEFGVGGRKIMLRLIALWVILNAVVSRLFCPCWYFTFDMAVMWSRATWIRIEVLRLEARGD